MCIRIAQAEAVTALELASLEVPADVEAGGIVWASPGLTPTSDYTSWTKSYDSASISTMVTEAVSQFILTGTFYGWPGSDATPTSLYDVYATYPDSTWDKATCVANENAGVTLSWSFERGSTALYQQCGYVNGEPFLFCFATLTHSTYPHSI